MERGVRGSWSGLDVDAGDAGGDAGDDVAGDGVGAGGDFLPGDVGAHDFCHIAGLDAVHVGDVDHNLIHGDAAEDGAVGAVEVDACARVGEVVQVAISKADADGGNFGGAGGDVGVVVGDAVVFGEGAQEGDAAVEGEGVAEFAVVGGGHGGVAVEDAAQAYHVGAGGAVVEYGRAAAEVRVGERGGKAGYGLFVAVDLAVGEGDVICRGREVRVDAFEVNVGEVAEVLNEGREVLGQDTCSPHAGVYVDVEVRLFAVELAKGVVVVCLIGGGEGGAPSVLDDDVALGREAGAKDEGAGAAAGIAYAGGLADGGYAEEGDVAVIERAGNAFQSMAVCFSFDDGHLLVVGEDAAHNGEVVFHGIGVNQSPSAVEGCVLHGGILCPEAGQCNEKEGVIGFNLQILRFPFQMGGMLSERVCARWEIVACFGGKNVFE